MGIGTRAVSPRRESLLHRSFVPQIYTEKSSASQFSRLIGDAAAIPLIAVLVDRNSSPKGPIDNSGVGDHKGHADQGDQRHDLQS